MYKVSNDVSASSAASSTLRQLAIAFAVVVVLAAGLAVSASRWHKPDSYTQAVLTIPGDSVSGATLFALNCAGCHGSEADGRVGPSLHGVSDRRSDISLIEQVTSGKTLPMPQFQPEPKAMADLLSYLKTL